jgi:hypothetical protein
MTNHEPIEPDFIALDAQVLREATWPKPNARLQQLAELAERLGARLWLVQGGLEEVRDHARRTAEAASDGLAKAREAARRLGLKAEATSAGLDDVLVEWDRLAAATRSQLKAEIIPYTQRAVEHFFEMAVRRTPPFAENGAGFRDAVIYFSVVDEMARAGLSFGLLVTRDRDFANCKSPDAARRIQAIDLDSAIKHLEQLLQRRLASIFGALAKASAGRAAIAQDAVRKATHEIESFIERNLETRSIDVPGLGGLLQRPLSYRLADVTTLSLSPQFEDVSPSAVVQASAVLELLGEFEIIPYEEIEPPPLRVGEDLTAFLKRQALVAALGDETESRKRSVAAKLFHVQAELRLLRTFEGYSFVDITSVRHLSSIGRSLLNASGNLADEE